MQRNVTCQFWFLEMHSLPMADELCSFQFLDINETQQIGQCHLEHLYSTTLASRTKRNNK